ncbi:UvrABC system protein C [compost metagenome]
MKDAQGGIIYVGKSKSLKKRVQSYFYNNKSHSPKIKKLVQHVKDLEHIVTDTEFEAFMLECKLIQDIKPMYNRKMKNPLGYTYIVLRQKDGFRRLEITSALEENGTDKPIYFGPYTAGRNTVENAVQRIQECCRIACSIPFTALAANTPCLNHSLGLCLGRCLGGEAAQRYDSIMDRFIGLLKGTDRSLCEEMERSMLEAAEQFDFESAAKYRDCIEAANLLLNKKQVIEFTAGNHSIVVYEYLDRDTIKLFLIKRNEVLYSEKYGLALNSEIEALPARAKDLILSYFHREKNGQNVADVARDEIDAAQIIYSYLQSSACHHLLIPEKWMEAKGHHEMEGALREFLSLG